VRRAPRPSYCIAGCLDTRTTFQYPGRIKERMQDLEKNCSIGSQVQSSSSCGIRSYGIQSNSVVWNGLWASPKCPHHCRTHLIWNIRGMEWGWPAFWLVSQLYSILGIQLYLMVKGPNGDDPVDDRFRRGTPGQIKAAPDLSLSSEDMKVRDKGLFPSLRW
jgi:hypothetical protein